MMTAPPVKAGGASPHQMTERDEEMTEQTKAPALSDRVRLRAPWDATWPDVYTVVQVFDADGQPAAMLEGVEPAFLLIYLEVAA